MGHLGFVGLTLLLAGGGLAAAGRLADQAQAVYEDWVTVEGVMLTCSIVKRTVELTRYQSTRGTAGGFGSESVTVWDLQVSYRYFEEGRDRIGTTLANIAQYERITGNGVPSDRLKELAARYAPDRHIPVLYNPNNPDEAVLMIERAAWIDWSGLAGIGTAIIGGLLLVWSMMRSWR